MPTMFSSSLARDPALSLPSPSVQNQIHELAKTLPPPRKQNIACDACRCALNPLSLVSFHSLIPQRLASLSRPPHRQRKVKCHQLPGQLKARPLPSTPRCPSLTVPGAFPVSSMASPPLPSPITRTHTYNPRSALYGEKLSVHVRTSPSFLSPVRRQVNVRLFRHHAQQATSEKKRIATVNRRPRAYTSNAQPRSVFSLSLMSYGRVVCVRPSHLRLSMLLTSLATRSAHPLLTSRSCFYL
jgi:hypothetical protein